MTRTKRNVLRISIGVLGAVFAAVGIFREETAEVFDKAVRICLECIGIG